MTERTSLTNLLRKSIEPEWSPFRHTYVPGCDYDRDIRLYAAKPAKKIIPSSATLGTYTLTGRIGIIMAFAGKKRLQEQISVDSCNAFADLPPRPGSYAREMPSDLTAEMACILIVIVIRRYRTGPSQQRSGSLVWFRGNINRSWLIDESRSRRRINMLPKFWGQLQQLLGWTWSCIGYYNRDDDVTVVSTYI